MQLQNENRNKSKEAQLHHSQLVSVCNTSLFYWIFTRRMFSTNKHRFAITLPLN